MKVPWGWLLLMGAVGVVLGLNRRKIEVPHPAEKRSEKIDITPQVEAFVQKDGKTGDAHP